MGRMATVQVVRDAAPAEHGDARAHEHAIRYGDSYRNRNRHGDSYCDGNGRSDADNDHHANSDSERYGHSDGHSNGDGYCYRHSYDHADADRDRYFDCDGNSDCHGDEYSDRHLNSHRYGYSESNANWAGHLQLAGDSMSQPSPDNWGFHDFISAILAIWAGIASALSGVIWRSKVGKAEYLAAHRELVSELKEHEARENAKLDGMKETIDRNSKMLDEMVKR
jgi:hypothetical protein